MAAPEHRFSEEISNLSLTGKVSNFSYLIRVSAIRPGTFRVKSIFRDSVSPVKDIA